MGIYVGGVTRRQPVGLGGGVLNVSFILLLRCTPPKGAEAETRIHFKRRDTLLDKSLRELCVCWLPPDTEFLWGI